MGTWVHRAPTWRYTTHLPDNRARRWLLWRKLRSSSGQVGQNRPVTGARRS